MPSKDKIISLLITIGFVITSCILLYPSFTDAVNNIEQTNIIGTYESDIIQADVEEIKRMKAEAIAYNESIAEEQKINPFAYRGNDVSDEEYENALCISKTQSTMGFLEIPNIYIYLPVLHGTSSEELEHYLGHMYGTSLINGGPSTHAVIAGHTGLQQADLFTDLTKLEIGDVFYIHVLDEIHVYTVCEINVVLPEEEDKYLQIEDGKDYITLYTCTPYGVNDHRLLVKGERTMPDIVKDNSNQASEDTVTVRKNQIAILKSAGIACIPTAILLIGIIRIFPGKKFRKNRYSKK